ncbi:glycosyltransferase family 2 protein [Aestuariibaculum sediminum]|uniref:Glycosyltransferase family 2 protein n=1 Tax=Aestuariibaculum sediminum TaxID=2770637 RepID=A0A8J6Q1M0_9FLAO|nr:glycosyltransferase family 2 protein [Aestuariibaculum sediminum]MBD0833092.1 glycosyltransferase family 2 protein [Aestuariibaculum sediminum]
MSNKLVSIIIPTYNRGNIIGETLNSILEQTYANWECIIVDDGSTDNTGLVVQSYIEKDARFKYFERPVERLKGGNAARNFGFEKSQGEYVNWFDSDDVMLPEFLNKKVEVFNENKSLHAVLHKNRYSNYLMTQFRDSKFEYSSPNDLYLDYALERIEIQTCGFMWRKNYLADRALFDENLERYQDNEFHIRMLATKPRLKILDEVLATIRGGNGDKNQISSRNNVSKKKLHDIFYYRYQSLNYSKALDKSHYLTLLNGVYKKLLWSFYAYVLQEKSFVRRTRDIFKSYNKLKIVYFNKRIPLVAKVKSHLYLFYIAMVGRPFK